MGNLHIRLAAVLATAATATALLAAPVEAQTDTTPPAVGTCHTVTFREAGARSDPDPAVACSQPHTTVTHKIIRLNRPVNWGNTAHLNRTAIAKCGRALINYFNGRAKALQMSAYSVVWFEPTAAQKRAGAAWMRCDVAIIAPGSLQRLSARPLLGSLPHPDRIAKCRQGESGQYRRTPCSRRHSYRATFAVKYPGRTFPGQRRIAAFAHRKCDARLNAYYAEWPLRADWQGGFRHIVCLRRTTR